MGPGFDNRTDAALNMTAAALYLADLKKDPANPQWRDVIGHYSGQGRALAKYATYSAGQMLIMAVDAADGVTSPLPPPGADIEVTVGVTQGGIPTKFNLKAAAAAIIMLAAIGSTGLLVCCSAPMPPAPTPRQQIAEAPIKAGFDWSTSTFRFEHDADGKLIVVRQPLRSR
jgi:hypothetical protein